MTELMNLQQFAAARHSIWLKRAFDFDWPQDGTEVLAEHHYTNLWREVDRHSFYLFNNIQQPLGGADIRIVANTILFRVFNKIETYEALTAWIYNETAKGRNPMDVEAMFAFLSARKGNFTGAYVRCPDLKLVCAFIVNDLKHSASEIAQWLQMGNTAAAWKAAKKMYSFGNFLVDQLIMDLDWLGGPLVYRAFMPKWGPGAKRGLDRALEAYEPNSMRNFQDLILDLEQALPPSVRPLVYGQPAPIDERVLEHTLCEYEKYMKFQTRGEARVKMRTYRTSTTVLPSHPLPYSWTKPAITEEEK